VFGWTLFMLCLVLICHFNCYVICSDILDVVWMIKYLLI